MQKWTLGNPAEDQGVWEMIESEIHWCTASANISVTDLYRFGLSEEWMVNCSWSLQPQLVTELWLLYCFWEQSFPKSLSSVCHLLEICWEACWNLLICSSDCWLVCDSNVSVLANQILHQPSAGIITVAVLSLHLTAWKALIASKMI